MMILLVTLLGLVSQAQRPVNPPDATVVAEVRARLAVYETRASRGESDPLELQRIARLVLEAARESNTFTVWSEACASDFAGETGTCATRLRQAFGREGAPLTQRAAAGGALVRSRAPEAAELLYGVVKDAGPKDLASVASQLLLLPKPQAVVLLTRALTSPSGDDQATACQALARLDSGETRQALAEAIASIPPGTPAWLACTVARARLNEPDTTWKLGGISSYLEGDALLEAADAMAAIGNDEAALDAVRKVVRQGRPPQQLSAAMRLATLDRDAARAIVDAKLGDRDPAIRARALQVERLLDRPPSSVVRAQLGDPYESVRLRAAEAVLDWVARVAKAAPAADE